MGPIPARYFWPGLCIALLSFSVGVGVIAIKAANSDGGAEIVESGDMDKQIREGNEYGWSIEVVASQSAPDGGRVPVQIVVRSSEDSPLGGLEGSIQLRDPSKSGVVDESKLTPVEDRPGVYRAELPIDRDGVWDFVVDLDDGERQTTTRIRESI
jgi:nitrogen fixation protein FixH